MELSLKSPGPELSRWVLGAEAALAEEVRMLRRAMSCFFSIDALENYMRKLFTDVEEAVSSEADEVRSKYVKLLTLPITGGLMGLIDDVLNRFSLANFLPGGLRIALYVMACAGVVFFAFLWYKARLITLEKLRKLAYERSFVAGELISYIRSFAGSFFSGDAPRDHGQITTMIALSWVALGLYFAESYGVEDLRERLHGFIGSSRALLAKMMDELKGKPIFLGLPPEARQPFLLLEERLAS